MPLTSSLQSSIQTTQKKRQRDVNTSDITHKSARLITAEQPENIVQFFKHIIDPDNKISANYIPLCVHAQQWLDQQTLLNPTFDSNGDHFLSTDLPELDIVKELEQILMS